MNLETRTDQRRVLLVADWAIDPHAVVRQATRHDQMHPTVYGLLVPAWLHGLDWAGDPEASVPCARRQVDAIRGLARARRHGHLAPRGAIVRENVAPATRSRTGQRRELTAPPPAA